MNRLMKRHVLLLAAIALVAGCPTARPTASLVLSPSTPRPAASAAPSASPVAAPTPIPGETPTTLLAVGDIASAKSEGDEATSRLLDGLSGPILALGDLVYENGTAEEFATVFEPSWGRHKARIKPLPGNHEYNTPQAAGYFGYFGASAGDPAKGFYAFDAGPHWRVLMINSELELRIAASGAESLQLEWVEQELTAHRDKHVIAAWHHPRYTSGPHGDTTVMDPYWDLLVAHGAELVLAGHDHMYERFAPIGASDQRDDAKGLRSFVVGTGGATLYPLLDGVDAHSEAVEAETWGVLKLELYANRYAWEFVPVAGKTFSDRGEGACR